jgi:divalent metal cation (Fe/Co/Zn/Cd) transporter
MTTNMDDSTTSEKAKELFVLRISTILTVIYAVIGIFIAILSDSLTLFVDALHSVVDVVVSVLAIFVVRKIQEPPNPHYNYG